MFSRNSLQIIKRIIETAIFQSPLKLAGQAPVLGIVGFAGGRKYHRHRRVAVACFCLRLKQLIKALPVVARWTRPSTCFEIAEKLIDPRIDDAHTLNTLITSSPR